MASPKFGPATTGTEVAGVFRDQIQGKHVLITGTSPNSIGEAAALALVRSARPALLILASRTESKLDEVARRVEQTAGAPADAPISLTSQVQDGQAAPALASTSTSRSHGAAQSATVDGQPKEDSARTVVRTVVLDLASQHSVREAARAVALLTTHIDVLINCAGINQSRRQLSPEGIELTFATNHVGPFLLVQELRPLLRAAADRGGPATRIVNVSSSGHRMCSVRFADYNFERDAFDANLPADQHPRKGLPAWTLETTDGFPSVLAYGMSKCANVLFSVGLRKRFLRYSIDSFAVDPGNIHTNLERDIAPGFKEALKNAPAGSWKSTDQGCATLLVAAFDPTLSGSNGVYLADCQLSRPAWFAVDKAKADQLWRLSEKLTGLVAGKNRL